jgi:hypothetical protein
MGLLVSFFKYGRFKNTIYGKMGTLVVGWFGCGIPTIFPEGWGLVPNKEGSLDGLF